MHHHQAPSQFTINVLSTQNFTLIIEYVQHKNLASLYSVREMKHIVFRLVKELCLLVKSINQVRNVKTIDYFAGYICANFQHLANYS